MWQGAVGQLVALRAWGYLVVLRCAVRGACCVACEWGMLWEKTGVRAVMRAVRVRMATAAR